MPDYRLLAAPGSIAIAAALRAGRRDLNGRTWLIFLGATACGILLTGLGMSAWSIPGALFAGSIGSYLYHQFTLPKWRIWAYSGVADIHQFQRCAELESLLPTQSHAEPTGFMNNVQRRQLEALQIRFSEDVPFIDDPGIPQVSKIYASLYSLRFRASPLLTIDRRGITTWSLGFVSWDQIWNEHVARKSFSRSSATAPGSRSGSIRLYLCFTCPDLMFEYPLSEFDVRPGELDQMLYIHRGRHEQDKSGAAPVIPLNREL